MRAWEVGVGLAMDSETNLEHNVCEGVHVRLAASRNSNLEHIDNEVVTFKHIWQCLFLSTGNMRKCFFGVQLFMK